ncbi:MAG: hypothetical protein WCC17_03610 [Candidatus Nitrosopolaris sp.]
MFSAVNHSGGLSIGQKRRVCPNGMYEDFTDGILHCHNARGTRELAPSTPPPQWQNAYGDDFASPSSQDWSYDEEGYGYASPPLIPPSSQQQTLAPPAPVPQTLIGPITSETHPSKIKKSANDRIEEQKKRQEEKEKDKDKKKKTPKTKKISIPPNFPDTIEITHGEEPYPEEQGVQESPQAPTSDIPPLELSPGQDQQPIYPTIPPTTPGRGPTLATPPQTIITTPSSCDAVASSSPTQSKNFTNGCGKGNDAWISCRAGIGTGPNGNTTPESGNQKIPVSTLIKNSQHFHAIYHFKTQDTTDRGHVIGAEVTGGYCGSNDNVPVVGVTIGVDGKGQILRKKIVFLLFYNFNYLGESVLGLG